VEGNEIQPLHCSNFHTSKPKIALFDFEKLTVYQKAKAFQKEIATWLKSNPKIDSITRDQLRRAALSIPLNIAEGTGRFTPKDRRNFYVIARSSIFEVVAILDILKDDAGIEPFLHLKLYQDADELSRILFVMVRKLEAAA
jgi:four helix bundle protein